MEGQKVGERVGIVGRLGDDPVLVETGDDADGLGHEVVDFPDHIIAPGQLRLGEVDAVAQVAGLDHLVPFSLPGLLGERRDIGGLDDFEPSGWIPGRVKDAQALEDGGAVCRPLLVLGQGKSDGQEPPGGPDFVVPFLHVAGLTRGSRDCLGKGLVLLEEIADAVLGGGVHLPLRMVKAHMAGLAGLWLLGFCDREDVPGVAGIAGGAAESGPRLLELAVLCLGLEADLVAPSAALHPFHHGNGLGVGCGHGLHGRPGQGVLTLLELGHLFLVALGAGVRGGDSGNGIVVGRFVVLAVTSGAVDIVLAVFAQLPIADDVGGGLLMALDALLAEKGRNQKCNQQESDAEKQGLLLHLNLHLLFYALSRHPARYSIPQRRRKKKKKKAASEDAALRIRRGRPLRRSRPRSS